MNKSLVEQRQIIRKNIIFNHIRKNNGLLSRNDITRITNYSMTTVASLVDSLTAEGLVQETESSDSRVGRRPLLLSVTPDSILFAGIDCTISNINITVINCLEEVVYEHTLSQNIADASDMLDAIENSIRFLRDQNPQLWQRLENITIGLPGKTDTKSGIGISFLSIKDWHSVDVLGFLSPKFDKNFFILNNVDAMVMGYQASANLDKDHITLFILLRRGVGIKLFSKGNLMSDYGVICEFGHLQAKNSNRLCSCGKRGCYDTEISQTGILNKLREAVSAHQFSELSKILKDSTESATFECFLNLIRTGNTAAMEIFNETAAHIAELLATALLIFSPDRIVLSSEMCRLEDIFKHTVESILDKKLPPVYPVMKPHMEYILPSSYLCSKGAAIVGLNKKFHTLADIT